MKATYSNGQKDGFYEQYLHQEHLLSGTYKEGKRVGIWIEYDPATHTQRAVEYQNGEPIQAVEKEGSSLTLKRTEQNRVVGKGSFRIESTSSHTFFQPESYFALYKENKSALFYIDPNERWEDKGVNQLMDEFTKRNWLQREIEGDSMKVFAVFPDSSKRLLYEGGCDPSSFIRKGRGNEYFPKGVILKGEFSNDQIRRYGNFVNDAGFCFCVGCWEHGELTKVTRFNPDFSLSYHGSFTEWRCVYSNFDLDSFSKVDPYSITEIEIADNITVPELEGELCFDSFIFARKITIGSHCFVNVSSVSFTHMLCLREIMIGDGSFSELNISKLCSSNALTIVPTISSEKLLIIAYNPSLQSIEIGDNSFANFTSFLLYGLYPGF